MTTVTVLVDGEAVEAEAGTPLGLLLHGRDATLRRSPKRDEPRGLFCGMGVCHECVVRLEGGREARACVTPVAAGMRVETRR